MLTGHSLGGIAAASLAADSGFTSRFHVTSVVTAGSPIARIDVPASVTVLSLEHEQDVVPMLDGRRNDDGLLGGAAPWTMDLASSLIATGTATPARLESMITAVDGAVADYVTIP